MERTILVVDDDEAFLEEMDEVLSSSGYPCVAVRDPLRVAEMAERVKPAVILMDLRMPGMNGFELSFELKRHRGLFRIPIIATSSIFHLGRSGLSGLSGFRRCLPKPFNPLDIIWMIEDVLKEENKCLDSCSEVPSRPRGERTVPSGNQRH